MVVSGDRWVLPPSQMALLSCNQATNESYLSAFFQPHHHFECGGTGKARATGDEGAPNVQVLVEKDLKG